MCHGQTPRLDYSRDNATLTLSPLPLRGRGIHFDPSPPEGERAG